MPSLQLTESPYAPQTRQLHLRTISQDICGAASRSAQPRQTERCRSAGLCWTRGELPCAFFKKPVCQLVLRYAQIRNSRKRPLRFAQRNLPLVYNLPSASPFCVLPEPKVVSQIHEGRKRTWVTTPEVCPGPAPPRKALAEPFRKARTCSQGNRACCKPDRFARVPSGVFGEHGGVEL